jgi:hypothetical protein
LEILSELLPEGADGGVSTAPLSYKGWGANFEDAEWSPILDNVLRCVHHMARIRHETGRRIHLDIEPEPDGLIENTEEFVAFFHRLLRHAGAADAQAIRDHIAVCLDICHFAVEFEDPAETLAAFEREGIRIGRVQVSSALRVAVPSEAAEREKAAGQLAGFIDPVYLHQVIGRVDSGQVQRYPDLSDALQCVHDAAGGEWRIHFHVPLFTRDYAAFGSTQDLIPGVFRLLSEKPLTRHLEIETYTWSVLPAEFRDDLAASIEREYRWVLDHLCVKPPPST